MRKSSRPEWGEKRLNDHVDNSASPKLSDKQRKRISQIIIEAGLPLDKNADAFLRQCDYQVVNYYGNSIANKHMTSRTQRRNAAVAIAKQSHALSQKLQGEISGLRGYLQNPNEDIGWPGGISDLQENLSSLTDACNSIATTLQQKPDLRKEYPKARLTLALALAYQFRNTLHIEPTKYVSDDEPEKMGAFAEVLKILIECGGNTKPYDLRESVRSALDRMKSLDSDGGFWTYY